MTDSPPTFTGIPCRGCFFQPNGCDIVRALVTSEFILTLREPSNPYDSNAIIVADQGGVPFGYIGREYAAEIAPWMDQGWFFLSWKTGRIGCRTIITLEPLKGAPAKAETQARKALRLGDTVRIVDLEIRKRNEHERT